MHTFYSAILAVLLVASPTLAQAASYEYTFHVPVTVSNLPSGATIRVECNLFDDQGFKRVGATGQMVTSTNGGYSGTLSATVPFQQGMNLKEYQCLLEVYSAANGALINLTTPALAPVAGWSGKMNTGKQAIP